MNGWVLVTTIVGALCLVTVLFRDARRPARAPPDNWGHELRYSYLWTGLGWIALVLTAAFVLWGLRASWAEDNVGGVVVLLSAGVLSAGLRCGLFAPPGPISS